MQYEFTTIPQMLLHRVQVDADRTAVHTKRDGKYQTRTWGDVLSDVVSFAKCLRDLGVQSDDRVALYSENRYEWIVADLAIQTVQAVHVPIHAPLTGKQVAYQVTDCNAKLLIVSTAELMQKVASSESALPADVGIVSFEPSPRVDQILERDITSWLDTIDGFFQLGDRAGSTDDKEVLAHAAENLSADSLATILYTSGTTGEPKGVMLSQRNLVTNAIAIRHAIDFQTSDVRLSFLPFSHIFARTCDLYTWIEAGAELALAESRDTVIADCQLIRPTILNAVPYFYELIRRAIVANPNADDDTLRQMLGGRIRYCCSGGAALPDHLFDFFKEKGIPILQGYGLTESSPVITLSNERHVRRGAVGVAIPDVEIAIADDGEVISKGPHIMSGYWQRPEDTAEVIRDGWLYTGDLGHIDEDGFLYITGRKKELIVTSAGKNIAPVMLESLLTEAPTIAQALVIGDNRSYLTALIVPDVCLYGKDGNLVDDAHAQIENAIQERLKAVSHHEQVRKFTVIPTPFSIDRGEMTPKLSLRRKVIEQNYKTEIDSMYASK